MSQSGPAYEDKSPKGIARAHRRRPDTSDETSETETEPEPACRSRAVGHSVERREWRAKPYSDRLNAFYAPCAWSECFPNGPPDVSDIETVVRSSHHPTTYHRLRETETVCEPESDHNHGDSVGDLANSQTIRESVGNIAELRDGDSITWSGLAAVAEVVESATDPSGVVVLVGSKGTEYVLEGRPECARAFYIEHFGCRSEINRVTPADGHPQSERV